MAVVIVALIMATAMMVAAFHALQMEHRGEQFRRLKARSRGRIDDRIRN